MDLQIPPRKTQLVNKIAVMTMRVETSSTAEAKKTPKLERAA